MNVECPQCQCNFFGMAIRTYERTEGPWTYMCHVPQRDVKCMDCGHEFSLQDDLFDLSKSPNGKPAAEDES